MNPLAIVLMLAMLATAGVLFVGLVGFFIGGAFNERYGNRLMRARVGLAAAGGHAAGPPVPHPALSRRPWSTLSQIYTRGGDQGRTSLGDGTRVAKHAARVAAYGTVDEANATIGLARLHTAGRAGRDARRGSRTTCSTSAPICAGPAAISRIRRRCAFARPRSSGWSARSTP